MCVWGKKKRGFSEVERKRRQKIWLKNYKISAALFVKHIAMYRCTVLLSSKWMEERLTFLYFSAKIMYIFSTLSHLHPYLMVLDSTSKIKSKYVARLYLTRRIQWWYSPNPRMRLWHPHFGLIWGSSKLHQKETC